MKIMKTFACIAVLLTTCALHVHAGEPEGRPVSIRGLVVSSGHNLIINDGTQDYVLLGVDNHKLEGKICEANGTLHVSDDELIIDVETIRIVASEYPEDDLVGEWRQHHMCTLQPDQQNKA